VNRIDGEKGEQDAEDGNEEKMRDVLGRVLN